MPDIPTEISGAFSNIVQSAVEESRERSALQKIRDDLASQIKASGFRDGVTIEIEVTSVVSWLASTTYYNGFGYLSHIEDRDPETLSKLLVWKISRPDRRTGAGGMRLKNDLDKMTEVTEPMTYEEIVGTLLTLASEDVLRMNKTGAAAEAVSEPSPTAGQ